MTELSITNKYGNVTIKDEIDDLDIYDMWDMFKRALLAMTYHPDSIKDLVESLCEEYEIEVDLEEKDPREH
jgi:hypothetical protein